jgi:hypothetical protein
VEEESWRVVEGVDTLETFVFPTVVDEAWLGGV